jgi:hypothetical protein
LGSIELLRWDWQDISRGDERAMFRAALLEQFSNSCALFSCVQGGSFLRKRPLIIVHSVYSKLENSYNSAARMRMFFAKA